MNEATSEFAGESGRPAESWPPSLADIGRLLPQFAILRMLGTGDVGAVYQALTPDGHSVAVKVLPIEISDVPGFAEDVAAVARQVIQLKHPGIAPLRAFGRTPDGHIFLVSEFVEGEPLSQRLGASRIIGAQAYALVEQICDALHYAHGHGVVHGGLHPENVFIDRSGGAKLVDFGLVPLVALGVAANESASHAAPEQVAGSAIDHRADIYSVGVILYELLTGELPHETSKPASEVAHVHPRIDAVIAKAMNFAPEQRYSQAAEMLRAVIAVGTLDGVRPAVLPQPAESSTVVHPAPVSSSPSKRDAAVRKWAAMGAGAMGVVIGAFLLLKPGGKPAQPIRPLAGVAEFPTAIVERPEEKPPSREPVKAVEKRPAAPSKPQPAEPAPGQWQPVALEGINGVTPLVDGGIFLTKSVRFSKYRGKDVAMRSVLRLADDPKSLELTLRANPQSRLMITLNQKPACLIQSLVADKRTTLGEVVAPWAVLEERWVTVEFAAIGDKLIGAVNDRPIEVKKPCEVLEAGAIGIYSAGGEFRSLEVALLDGVTREHYPEFVRKALDAADALLAKSAAAEEKPMPPPEPEKPKTSPEVEQWLAKVDGPFREAYEREVAKPFEAAVGDLRRAYLQAIERQTAVATGAGKGDDATLWHKERETFLGHGQSPPPDDSDNPTPAIKALRANFRASFARLDRERFGRGRVHFAKYDGVLAQNLTALLQRERRDDAALLTRRREELAKEWLAPPMVLAPIASGPALGAKTVAESPKQTLKETIDWLLQNDAELEVQEGNKWSRVLDARLIPSGRVAFGIRIDGAKAKAPPTVEDLRRLTALRNVARLELTNQFNDQAFEFLRELAGVHRLQFPGDKTTDALVDTLGALSELKSFQIRSGGNFTGKTLDLLGKLPALHEIDVENSGFNDEGAAAIVKLESLDSLNLRRTKITDAGLANIAKLRNLRRLEIDHCEGLTGGGLAALKTLRNLDTLDYLHDGLKDYAVAVKTLALNCNRVSFTRLRGKQITAEHITPLAEWRSLTHLALPDAGFAGDGSAALAKLTRIDHLEIPGAVFTDVDVDHLLGLKELRKLNLTGTQITDAGLMKLKALKGLKEVTINYTQITTAAAQSFGREHSGCKVIRSIK